MPLLAGWNADEVRGGVVLGKPVTVASFTADLRERFGEKADALLKLYPAATDDEALESAAALATDQFMGAATWRWIQAHQTTGGSPVYRYQFDRKIPVPPDQKVNGRTATAKDIGARHAGEIRVRVRGPRLGAGRDMGASGPRVVRADDELLDELRARGRSERPRVAEVAQI